MDYKLFIPCAGTGSRLGDLTRDKNKALIKVNGKEVIRHILDKFQESVPLVIALGYQGNKLRSFLEYWYPKRDIAFIEIDNYEGPGSGLGYTISKCRDELQCPFIFISNDTIVLEDIPKPSKNYVGYAEEQEVAQFRSVELNGNQITKLYEKGISPMACPYIGLAGIKNYIEFWESLDLKTSEFFKTGESAGLNHLISCKLFIEGIKFTWLDTGNPTNLRNTKNRLKNS